MTGVTSDVPDHTYSFGERIPITVAFDETVVVRPGSLPHLRIGLDSDPGVRIAPYSSGNNTDKLNFTYTVQDGDVQDDLQYEGTGALAGSVWDAAGNEATRALPAPGESGSLKNSSDIRIDHASLLLVPLDSAVDGEGDFTLLGGANHPEAFSVGGKTYAAVTAYGNPGDSAVTLMRVHQNGTLSYADSAGGLGWAEHVDAFKLGNATMVAVASSFYADSINLYRVHGNNDTLERVGGLPHGTGPLSATGARGVAAFAIGNSTFIAEASQFSDTVRLSRVHDNYTMTPVYRVTPPQGDVPQDLDAFAIGNSTLLFLTAENGGVNTLRVNGSGTMEVADGATDTTPGYELRGIYGADVVAVGGNTYAVVASAGGHAVQAIRIGANGSLAPAGLARHGDAANSDYRLPNPHDVAAFADGGRAYALAVAAGRGSGDLEYIQMIRLDGEGALSPVRRADNSTAGLEDAGDVSGVDVFDMGGALHAIVASRSSGSAGNSVQLIRLSHTSVAGVASASGNASLGTGGAVNITVAFDGRVNVTGQPSLLLGTGGSATYLSGSGGSSLTFNYTVREGDNAKRLDYAGRGALSGGDISDAGGNAVRLALPQPGSALSLAGASEVSVYGKPPEAVSVSSPDAGGRYGIGRTVLVNVTFDEPVEVTGAPLLNLTAGRNATYLSGSGGPSLLFNYTVGQGDASAGLDYTGTGALSLNGGTIADLGGRAWDPVLPAPTGSLLGGAGALVVDGVRPEVESVSSPNASGAYGAGRTILVNVTFDKPVVVSGTPRIALGTGGTGGAAEYISGSGGPSLLFGYTVRPGDSSPGLRYANESALSPGGGITDLAGNDADLGLPAPGPLPGTGDIVLDTAAPRVANVTSDTPDGEYGTGAQISVSVNFDEPVWHSGGAPALSLNVGGSPRNASYASGSGTPSLVFHYTVMSGDMADDLDYHGTGALSGDIADAAGNAADRILPPPGSPLSLSGTSALRLDGSRPTSASASAVFTGPNTVRIDYAAPLGPPENHTGPVYGGVSVAAGAEAPAVSESGLGTQAHTVKFGGDGAGRDQAGSISLLADLAGRDGGVRYEFTNDSIAVAAGASASTLSPPGTAPVVAIESDGFVRTLNATAAGDSARPAISLAGLAGSSGGGASATLPAERVAVIASFAEVSFPPGANAMSVPADGLLELYVSERAPAAQEIADGLGVAAADILEVRRIVEVGDNATRIVFDLPVRILLVGQANGTAFYAGGADGTVVPITRVCDADDTDVVHAQLEGSGECQRDSADGEDKIIYTYHLTRFGTAAVDTGDTCSATLSPPEIPLGEIRPGGQSAAAAQEVRGNGTLPLASVSVSAGGAWMDNDGAEVMPANATSVMAGGSGAAAAWMPLGGAPVALQVDGGSASAQFVVDVPRDAVASSPVMASQALTYTVSCDAPTE